MRNIAFFCVLFFLISVSCAEIESSYLEETISVETSNQDIIEHNLWMYEMMSYHYFWNTEISDSSSLDFSKSPISFFKSLLSPQDRFSWCEQNDAYIGDVGFEYQSFNVDGILINRVLFVYNPILQEQGLKRGDYVRFNASTLEKGIINEGEFVPQDSFNLSRLEMTRGASLSPTVSFDSVYQVGDKRIGYFVYDQFESTTDVAQIITRMGNARIDDLIIDLRYNPGGYVSTSVKLASFLVPKNHLGKLYQQMRYNDVVSVNNQLEGKGRIDSIYLDDGIVTAQRNLDLSRLVILTTKNSASASESLVLCLKPYMDVVTIGSTTRGKDVGSYTISNPKYKYQLQPITFRYYNAEYDSVPVSGIIPDIMVQDDLNHERGDTNEALLGTAINYLTTGLCTLCQVEGRMEKEFGKSSIEIKNKL